MWQLGAQAGLRGAFRPPQLRLHVGALAPAARLPFRPRQVCECPAVIVPLQNRTVDLAGTKGAEYMGVRDSRPAA